MTRTATVKPGQTLPDLAIQWCGKADAWAGIARLNNLGMTAALAPGAVLLLPDVSDKRVRQYFQEGGYEPGVGEVTDWTVLEGIGYWAISIDFEMQ